MGSDRDDDEDTGRRRPTDAERRHHAKSYPLGMPILPELDVEPENEDDFGSPYDDPIVPTRRDAEAVKRSGRDPDEPVRTIEVSAMFRGFGRALLAHLDRKYEKPLGDVRRLVAVVEGTTGRPGLGDTVAAHAQIVGPARTAASWALRGTVAAVLVLGGFLYKRGSDEQHAADEIQTLRRDVAKLEAEILQLRNQGPRP